MRKLVGVLAGVALAAGSLVAVGVSPAGASGKAPLYVNAFVNGGGGFPTGELQLHRECTAGGPASTADSDPFTTSQTNFMTTSQYPGYLPNGIQTCTVSVLESGGMHYSIACVDATPALLVCSSNDAVTYVGEPAGIADAATITVTFYPPELSYLNVEKAVVGEAPAGTQYTIVVQCSNATTDTGPVEYIVSAAGPVARVELDFAKDFGGKPADCVVSEPDTGGATASFACKTPSPPPNGVPGVVCDPAGNMVEIGDRAGLEATITVTNTHVPEPALPVVASPSFTG